jgi:hypothetical protein
MSGADDGRDDGDERAVREQDRFLPIANISRIMKKALPPNAKIAKDAKETVQECVSEFISFITSEYALFGVAFLHSVFSVEAMSIAGCLAAVRNQLHQQQKCLSGKVFSDMVLMRDAVTFSSLARKKSLLSVSFSSGQGQ